MNRERFYSEWYGRIYTDKIENIEKIKNIIKEIDFDEYEYYLPDDFIATYDGEINKIEYKYNGKFDISINELLQSCYNQGIKALCTRRYDMDHYDGQDEIIILLNEEIKVFDSVESMMSTLWKFI